jgi:hypothetical protein
VIRPLLTALVIGISVRSSAAAALPCSATTTRSAVPSANRRELFGDGVRRRKAGGLGGAGGGRLDWGIIPECSHMLLSQIVRG